MNQLNLTLNTDKNVIPNSVPSQRILEIVVLAPQAKQNHTRSDLNLALVIDRSGSMGGYKIEYVKEAVCHVLNLLQERDVVSIVAYDDRIDTLVTNESVTPSNRHRMQGVVRRLQAGSSTNLGEGWLTGCQLIGRGIADNRITRTLLLTDGLANVGITDAEELGFHARQLYERGISTSTFGVGGDFNEYLLEQMANLGGGRFYYIESPYLIPELFARELQMLSMVTAREVEISISLPPYVDVEVLGDWKVDRHNGSLRINIGNLISELQREIYVKLLLPPQKSADQLDFMVKALAKNEEGDLLQAESQCTFLYKDKTLVDQAAENEEVKKRFSTVDMAQTSKEALRLERAGRRAESAMLMNRKLMENAAFLIDEDVDDYQTFIRDVREGMREEERKRRFYKEYERKQRRFRD